MALEHQLVRMRAEYQTTCDALQGESQAERTIRDPMCDANRRGSELVQLESQLTTMGRITQDWQARFQEADAARHRGAAACEAAMQQEIAAQRASFERAMQ